MIDFKEIELKDKKWIDVCFQKANYKGCEYSFTNNFIWRKVYHPMIAEVYGNFCAITGADDQVIYSYPAGAEKIKDTVELLIEDAKNRGIKFHLRGITSEQMKELEHWFPERFTFTLRREDSDYIYTTEKLTNLSGKKMKGKRNHIARFKDCDDWGYFDITKETLAECFEMSVTWCKLHGCGKDEELKKEFCAVQQAFQYFEELNLQGGFIRRKGEIVAYTMGEPLSSDTFVVHIEKAFPDIQGAYPIINQQFVEHNCQNFIYVNREEDVGDEGLRKAKLSYYPDILLDKYEAVEKV